MMMNGPKEPSAEVKAIWDSMECKTPADPCNPRSKRVSLKNCPLRSKEVKDGDEIDMDFTLHRLQSASGATMITKAYKFSGDPCTEVLPGPILRIPKGISFKIRLHNKVPQVPNKDAAPFSANLHTHGLSISPNVDDIAVRVKPGESHEYEYRIRPDHAGGLHWYHSHVHRYVNVQAGGGAAGLIVIEDAPDGSELPPEIAEIPRDLVYIHRFDPKSLRMTANHHGDLLFDLSPSNAQPWYTVNGYSEPELELEAGSWKRWRMLYADAYFGAQVTLSDPSCSLRLIAKDGIYLADGSRAVPSNKLQFHPASRLDVLVNCPTPQSDLTLSAVTVDGDVLGTKETIAHVKVVASASEVQTAEQVSGKRPCLPSYLSDLRNEPVEAQWGLAVRKGINGQKWQGETGMRSLHNMTAGTVEQWDVTTLEEHAMMGNTFHHVLHAHVHPMQLMSDVGDWHRRGDWVDSISGHVSVKVNVSSYVGPVVIHCHQLMHEDMGYMGAAWVNPGATLGEPSEPWGQSCPTPLARTADAQIEEVATTNPESDGVLLDGLFVLALLVGLAYLTWMWSSRRRYQATHVTEELEMLQSNIGGEEHSKSSKSSKAYGKASQSEMDSLTHNELELDASVV